MKNEINEIVKKALTGAHNYLVNNPPADSATQVQFKRVLHDIETALNPPLNLAKISARFNSKCAETGDRISKGESMVYDYNNKKAYCLSSDVAQNFLNGDKECRNTADMVSANEEAGFEKFQYENR